jgi:hypothetical protein
MPSTLPCLAMLLAAVAAAPPVAAPPRRRVHVDHLDPGKVRQYEEARRAWLSWIVAHHARDPWGGLFLQVGGSTFLTVRPFTRFAELDPTPTPPPVPLDRQEVARYNALSDAALVPPHHDEIWLRQPGLDYQPARPVSETGGAGQLVTEQVRLVGEGPDDYLDAWKLIRAELFAANHPVARIVFVSQFGSGRHVSLWLAPTREAYRAAPPIDEVLARRLGRPRAQALLARWRRSVLERDEQDLLVRPDLTNPELRTAPP